MIYLFDDTSELLIKQFFNKSDYYDVLKFYSSASLPEVVNETELHESECVMIHRSYKDKELFRYITSELSKWGREKPLVVFSGEDDSSPIFRGDACITKISKELFYQNASYFLDFFRKNEVLDLSVLAYGEKKDADYALSRVQALLSNIKFLKGDDPIPIEKVDLPKLQELIIASEPEIALPFDGLLSTLSSGRYPVGLFRENLKSIAEGYLNYGKNIHHWRY